MSDVLPFAGDRAWQVRAKGHVYPKGQFPPEPYIRMISDGYFEAAGSVRRAISVIKKRTGNHESTIREFHISQSGLALGEPLDGFQGVLRGVPTISAKEFWPKGVKK